MRIDHYSELKAEFASAHYRDGVLAERDRIMAILDGWPGSHSVAWHNWITDLILADVKPEPVRPEPKFKNGDRVFAKDSPEVQWIVFARQYRNVTIGWDYRISSGKGLACYLEHNLTLAPTDDEIVASLGVSEWIEFDRYGTSCGPYTTYSVLDKSLHAGGFPIRFTAGFRLDAITNIRRVPAPAVM